jgi:glycogen operon protein
LNDPKTPSDWFKVDGVDALVELALNLHWSWNHAADELWEALDKDLWATTQNPWVILRTVSREKIKAALGSPEFRQKLDTLLRQNREPMLNPPIVWEIDSDPVLAGTKLIAEAWDSGGLYQVGSFGQDKWKEWNGHFRDDIRSFVKGDEGTVVKLRNRIAGSPDLYDRGNRPAGQSINFVTCHDGFTLNDLVSYDVKHNAANRESNRDGTDANLSWNCGVEGPTDGSEIHQLRMRQIRNLLALTLLSSGTPMLLMGDEVCRTQLGNNNAYCQDNATGWFDWSLCDTNADLLRFVR